MSRKRIDSAAGQVLTEAKAKPVRFNPADIQSGRLKIPKQALRFEAAVAVNDEATPVAGDALEGTVPVSMRARSGNVLKHWFWGRCVHDFAGMRPASAKLPFDYCHDDREALGYSDAQDTSGNELVMHGVLIPFTDTDRANEVIHKAALGFEWQGSIYFDPDELLLEYVPEGHSSPVNGGMFEGPGVIFREWLLRGAAVCPYGYDPNTSVQFSKSGDVVAVSFAKAQTMATTSKKGSLTKHAPNRHDRRKAASLKGKKTSTKLASGKPAKPAPKGRTSLAADDEDEEGQQSADDEEGEQDADEPEGNDDETEVEDENDCDCAGEEGCECDEEADAEDEPAAMEGDEEEGQQNATKQGAKAGKKTKLSPAQKEAQRFVNAFGPQGGVWFSQGKTFDQAQALFNSGLRKENAELRKKVDDQASQLTALRGEEEPVSFGTADDPKSRGGKGAKGTKQVTGLSTGMSKFAGALKLPGR